jgi:shikimate dehydrogenase
MERVAALAPRALAAVFGDPVGHSRSPQMHTPAMKARGIDGQYVRIHVRPDEFLRALDWCRAAGFVGLNCTIPHKLAALEAADEVDPLARRLGAVNTLVFLGDKVLGFNTDGPGLLRALDEEFHRGPRGLRVLVFGAGGGAGRAAAVQCALAGCAGLTLVNRTREKAEAVAAEVAGMVPDCRVAVGTAAEVAQADLIINAASVGMSPEDPELVPRSLFRPDHFVYDMIYSPPETRLLRDARAAGARAANGLSMLLHQGAASFAHWFGEPVPIGAMREGLRRSFSDPDQ